MAELFPPTGRTQLGEPLADLGIIGSRADDDFLDVPGPTHWPEVASVDAAAEWADLRSWVGALCDRFSFLDHHVVPRCWWRHNEHVEALVALRDHERSSFSAIAPATAPVEWLRALRDVASLLRGWTAELSCGVSHQDQLSTLRPLDDDEWERFVAGDVEARQAEEVDRAVR